MNEINLNFFSKEIQNQIVSIILVGGMRYDKCKENKDTDYMVIIDDDDFEYELMKDSLNNVDYLCYGKKYIQRLIDGETHHNKYFVMLDLFNQDRNIVYGNKVFDFNIDNPNDRDFIFNLYKKQLNDKKFMICTNKPYSKYLYYTFSLFFYLKNKSYVLSEEQLKIVHNVHRFIHIDKEYVRLLCDTFDLDNDFFEGMSYMLCECNIEVKPNKPKVDLREVRKPLLNAFDLWEKAVLRGREEDSEEIMKWYYDILDLDEVALYKIPDRIKYYLN